MKNTPAQAGEIILVDGHKIILHYADRPQPKVMGNIQNILFNQNISPTKYPKICTQDDNMR